MNKVMLCVRSVGRNPDNPSLRSSKECYVPVEQTLELNGGYYGEYIKHCSERQLDIGDI